MASLSSLLPFIGARHPLVAHLRLSGPIGMPGPLRGGFSLATVERQLKTAFGMRGIAAVAISINSPGGAPVQSHLVFDRIRGLAEEKRLPVIAYVEDVAASGGYMIAAAADEIVVDPTSVVGSIGVVSAGFGFEKAIEKLGIERRVHTAGTRKVVLDPFRAEEPGDVAHLLALQADIHAMFIDLVRSRRGDRLAADADLFSGLFWTGTKAVELGLADRLGTMHADIRLKFGPTARIRSVSAGGGLLRRRVFGAAIAGETPALLSADEVIAALESRFLYSRYGL